MRPTKRRSPASKADGSKPSTRTAERSANHRHLPRGQKGSRHLSPNLAKKPTPTRVSEARALQLPSGAPPAVAMAPMPRVRRRGRPA
jgi:hypothetical protein